MYGNRDRVRDYESSELLFKTAASKDRTLKVYEGLEHDLIHEPQKQHVINDFISWLEDRT